MQQMKAEMKDWRKETYPLLGRLGNLDQSHLCNLPMYSMPFYLGGKFRDAVLTVTPHGQVH